MSDATSMFTGMPLGSVYEAAPVAAVVEMIDEFDWGFRLAFEDVLDRMSPRQDENAWFDPDAMGWVTGLGQK